MKKVLPLSNGARKEKKELRDSFHQKIKKLSQMRRKEAEERVTQEVYERLKGAKHILSFQSMGSEIGTHRLNQKLASEGRLLLPKVEGESLKAFSITDLKTELLLIQGDYFEPNPKLAKASSDFDCILVPGLVFDRRHYRLGYGLGHYDRFLLPLCGIKKVGVAFTEQLYAEDLPIEPHDQRVDELYLF